MKQYRIVEREAGNIITWADTLSEANSIIKAYETEDKEDGKYTKDFYEIQEWSDEINAYSKLMGW